MPKLFNHSGMLGNFVLHRFVKKHIHNCTVIISRHRDRTGENMATEFMFSRRKNLDFIYHEKPIVPNPQIAQIFGIILHAKQGSVHLTWIIPWLLMTWRHNEPEFGNFVEIKLTVKIVGTCLTKYVQFSICFKTNVNRYGSCLIHA